MKRIKNYSMERILGNGSFGVVYYGHNTRDNSEIATKQISIVGVSDSALTSVKREISCMSQLSSPYIVSLKEVIKSHNNLYLVMEYCKGGDLSRYLKKNGRVSEELAQKWIKQIIEALLELNSKGIMHRDLKLANILITEDNENGNIKLADFGFARELEHNDQTWTRLGTPLFMAPEIYDRERYTYKADIWSLGVLSYQLLLGRLPYRASNIAGIREAQRKGVKFYSTDSISDEAKEFICAMLTYNHEHRPDYENLRRMPFITQRKKRHRNRVCANVIQGLRSTDPYVQDNVRTIKRDGSFAEHILVLQDAYLQSEHLHAALCINIYCSHVFNCLSESLKTVSESADDENDIIFLGNLMERLIYNNQRAYNMINRIKDETGITEIDANVLSMITDQLFELTKIRIRKEGFSAINKRLVDVIVYYNPSNEEARLMQEDMRQVNH